MDIRTSYSVRPLLRSKYGSLIIGAAFAALLVLLILNIWGSNPPQGWLIFVFSSLVGYSCYLIFLIGAGVAGLARKVTFRSKPLDMDDSICRRCKYNLHGLPRPYRCPECGLPFDNFSLHTSISRNMLAYLRFLRVIFAAVSTGIVYAFAVFEVNVGQWIDSPMNYQISENSEAIGHAIDKLRYARLASLIIVLATGLSCLCFHRFLKLGSRRDKSLLIVSICLLFIALGLTSSWLRFKSSAETYLNALAP